MRRFIFTLTALLLVCTPAQAGRFASLIAASALATRPAVPVPGPTPAPVDAKCDNCDGTGRVGDGTIEKPCPVCKGTGKRVAQDTADSQPTPWPGVSALLNVLKIKPNDVLVDYGCGADARLLIEAYKYTPPLRAVGVEIDPISAAHARDAVAAAGLSDRIQIVEGDSTKLAVSATVGIGYMWAETLSQLKPQIEKLERFACYGFAVPGLPMQASKASNGGDVFLYTRTVKVPVTQQVTTGQIDRLPRGSYCEICHGYCSNPMAHHRETRVTGYREVPATGSVSGTVSAAPVAKRKGHMETVCEFNRFGRKTGCHQVWVED